MKDYKRLTKRNDEGTFCIVAEEIAKEMAVWQEQHATGELAPLPLYHLGTRLCQLEDKIENGTLVELPCKVGDDAYIIQFAGSTHNYDKIIKTRVDGIVLFPNGSFDIVLPSKHFATWGWSVFPTKDEAEKQIEIFKEAAKMVDGKKGITLSVAVNKIKGEKE